MEEITKEQYDNKEFPIVHEVGDSNGIKYYKEAE